MATKSEKSVSGVSTKNRMAKLDCPQSPGVPVFGNGLKSGGFRCTKCGSDSHKMSKDQR